MRSELLVAEPKPVAAAKLIPTDAAKELQTSGMLTVSGVLSKFSARRLSSHVVDSLARARRQSGLISTPDPTLAQVLTPTNRWDHKLLLSSPVRAAMKEALVSLQSVLAEVIGGDACLWEAAALVSLPGAPQQQCHPDAAWQQRAPAFVVFLALSNVTQEMGPTIVLPGTQTERAHDLFNGGNAAGTRKQLLCSRPHRAPCLKRGDALVLDARCLHCGGANYSRSMRALFYFTFVRRGCERLALRNPSLRDELRGRRLQLDQHESWLASDGAFLDIPVDPSAALSREHTAKKTSLASMSKAELLGMAAEEDETGDCLAS